jgi:phosphoribosylaminoimidazole-succinocarboxamide synthase
MVKKKSVLSEGKAKTMHLSDQADVLIMEFRDDITAFNAEKMETIAGKGALNHKINQHLMGFLEQNSIKTCYLEKIDDNHCLVKKLDMIPLECVARNVAAGSFAKRFGLESGTPLKTPIFELFLKDDALGDPMIRDEHAIYFAWATEAEIAKLKALTLRVNALLHEKFYQAGMLLVDFKLEFGREGDDFILADELSPDGCRIWDIKSKEVLDKDRFRKDLGDVMQGYKKVAKRLGL